MSLSMVPNEIVLIIAEELCSTCLSALLRTCRSFAVLLTPHLHNLAVTMEDSEDGVTPLVWAVIRGHEPFVRLLHSRGVDINIPVEIDRLFYRDDPVTAVQKAVEYGHIGILKFLLENGATPICFEETLLYIAIINERTQIVRWLLENPPEVVDINKAGYPGGLTALHYVATARYSYFKGPVYQDVEIVRILLEHGADPRAEIHSRTPCEMAAELGNTEVVKFFLEQGYPIELEACHRGRKWSLLQLAAQYGRAGVVNILIDYGADTTYKHMGVTALKLISDLRESEEYHLGPRSRANEEETFSLLS